MWGLLLEIIKNLKTATVKHQVEHGVYSNWGPEQQRRLDIQKAGSGSSYRFVPRHSIPTVTKIQT